jgi:hypothetical protein
MINYLELFFKKNFLICLLICTFFSFLFFQFNFLNIAGSKNFFDTPSMNLEVEVTDGIINGKETEKFSLGRFDRSKFYNKINPRDYKKFFIERNQSGFFNTYNTSYGLQVKVYGFIDKYFKVNLLILNIINSLILASLLLIFTSLLRYQFSYVASFTFLISYIISPWNVSFANEVRLIQWTWLLPIFFIFFFNIYKFKSFLIKNLILNLFIFLSLLLKLLISYEFFTSIVTFIFFSQIYFNIYNKLSKKFFFIQIFFLVFTIFLSILCALLIHLISLNDLQLIMTFLDRFHYNFNFFIKSETIDCNYLVTNNKLNYEYISHCISRIEVLFRYFIFRNFIPFLGIFENYLDPQLKFKLVSIMLNKQYLHFFNLFSQLNLFSIFSILVIFFNISAFLIFFLYTLIMLIINRYDSLNIIIIGSFFASISWFVFAKTYSYIHFHLCYVSWTFIFIPFTSMSLIEKIYIKSKN